MGSHESMVVLAISQVDDESQVAQETALPSSTRPSDHVSLVATFKFRDLRENSNDPAPPPNVRRQASGYHSHAANMYTHTGNYAGNGYGNNSFTSSNSNNFTTACALS